MYDVNMNLWHCYIFLKHEKVLHKSITHMINMNPQLLLHANHDESLKVCKLFKIIPYY